MDEIKSNNYSGDSIENTRKKKIDEFKRSFDKSVMTDDVDMTFDSDVKRVDEDKKKEDPYVNFSNDSTPLKRRKKSDEINSYSDSDTKKRIEKESEKELRKQQRENKRIEKNKARRNKRMFKWVWLCMVLIMGIVLSQVVMVGVRDMLAMDRDENPLIVKVTIPKNASIDDISQILQEKGIIDRADYFALYAKRTSSAKDFKPGDYLIETNKDYEAIINYLQSNTNRTDIITVQITEGMNVIEIAEKLQNEGALHEDDVKTFLKLCNSDTFDETYPYLALINNADSRYYKLEGYLFPDTYNFYKNEDPETIITRMLTNFYNRIYDTKDRYLGSDKSVTVNKLIPDTGYSLDEIITIASIIQAEAANKEDMYYISSILHNRLENGAQTGTSKLGCDCTEFYPYRSEEKVPADKKGTFKSTYNTHEIDGLPAGPICNPSLEAILAAMGPYDTNYYYFCHKITDDGSVPYYASSLADHEYNLTLIS